MPQQPIYFREHILLRLRKEKNMSALINDLLEEHFRKNEPESLTLIEQKRELEKLLIKTEAEEKLKAFENG